VLNLSSIYFDRLRLYNRCVIKAISVRKSVLVICTGNICRSPYGESKLKELLPELKVTSAGLETKISRLQGKPANALAIKIASEFGIDISQHKAKQLTQELVDEYDLILTMEAHQLEELHKAFPSIAHKTFTFGHWIGVNCIADPYRQGKHAFRFAFTTINDAANSWKLKLI